MANDSSDDTKIIAIKILNEIVKIISVKLIEEWVVPQLKCFSELKDIRVRKALVNTLVSTSLVVSQNVFKNKLLNIFQRY